MGRNDPFPCGSGKKYKQCCMTQLQSAAGGGTRAAAAHAQPPSAAADPGSMDAAQLQAFDEAMTEAARELIEQVRAWKANPQNRGRWGDEVDAALEITRNLSLHLLRLLLTHYAPGGQRRTPLPGYDECLALLTDALTRLRSGADQQWAWALALYERVQIEMAEVGFVPEMDAKVQEHLMRAIHEARLPLSELLRHQVLAVRSHYTRFGAATGAHDLNRMLERMIKKIDTRYVFPELETMLTQLAPLPGESLVEIVTGLMANPRPFWKELAMLLLLHPNPRLRCTLAERFRHGSGIAQLSPLGLRRLIGLRNWLPAEERPAVDELIKIVRKAGVVSAPLPPPGQSLTVYASIFDAVGKHALWAYVKDPKHYRRNAAVLVGQGQGVADVSEPRGFTRDMMDDQARDRIADSALVVDPHYLHRALAHFIAVGLEHDHPPPARLLEFHEMVVGGEYWKPLAVDPAAEIEALTATDPAAFAPARVAEVLAGTGQWPEQHAFADNWFEGSSVIEELLLTHVGAPAHWMEQLPLAAATILTWVMEPKRAIWTGRLLWNGLRLRAALTPQPVPWQDSVIVARALHEGIPLEQIPLMVAVARRSVEPARNRALRGQY
ncbi:SEC-C domain-containing protein [uncultured Thiodictyon sp.]|uniref:SEC-C domain-containing protein n=1 Tax=uncultured Thiodictyon sp. TaxID=1846217 RepID=UPI0025E0438C|nr:SEC-C domain-containing protein [uncultured Thiodictyon sp.]